tara:strand:- start:6967 stop:7476 length:510 start_codon:yes stop_codon:yes gene_type:complete
MANIQNTTQGVFDRLPIWAKGIIVLGGAYLLYKIGKDLIGNTRLDPNTRDNKQEEDGWNSEYVKDNSAKKATLSKAQMKQIANAIEFALDGYGTRDADLKRLFNNIKNNADFSGVNAAFGIRTIEAGRGTGWLSGNEKGTLTQVIKEADDSTITYINKHLQSKGIKYRI